MNTLYWVRSCYRISIWALGVFLLGACAIENNIPYLDDKEISNLPVTRSVSGADIPDDVFSYADVRITPVVATLQAIESEIHFMESFCELYGVPLWDYAEIEEEGNLTCCYVPLFDQNAPLRINTIWFFSVENGRMSYMPIRRDSESIVGSGQEFLFDALSSVIFGESGSSRVFKKQAQTRSWITVTSCFDVYTGSESIGMTYQYTECNDKLIWIDHFKWHSAPDGGGGGGDGIGFGIDVTGGGGGSGSVTSNAESLFTNDRFTVDNWKITEKLIAKIIDDCMGSALFQSVKSTLGGNKITLNFSDEEGSSYNLSTKVLTLGVELESNQLFHELWHLYQTLQESTSSFQNSTMNQELEAHYAQYLYLSKKSWFSGSEYEKRYHDSSRGLATRDFRDYINRKGNLVNQQDNDVLQIYIETIAIPVFRKFGYPTERYDATQSGKSVFSNLNTLTKNCN